jgi:membrane-bound ClpP family serine protease
MTETIQACLIGVAILLVGVGLLVGDIVIPSSPIGGGLLAFAGICYLVSALLRILRRHPLRKETGT